MPTAAQKRFLQSCLPDIFHGEDAALKDVDPDEFVRRVSGMNFDDGSPASPVFQRVAKNLRDAGMLSELNIHRDVIGQGYINLVFSEAGAKVLCDLRGK